MLRCGFAKVAMTPPVGTRMMGFALRDVEKGCQSVDDPVFARVAYFEDAGEQVLIVTFDMCFIGKLDSFRFKGMLGSQLNLRPSQVLLNSSHTHTGPASGQWFVGDFLPANHDWLLHLGRAVSSAAETAMSQARPVRLRAGMSTTTVPMNRRRVVGGRALNRPNPDGPICNALPVVQAIDGGGNTVCVLFSASAHPSAQGGWAISAEYPGVAMNLIDERFGAPVAMFLQGTAGDAKTRVCGEGRDTWRHDVREDIEHTGQVLAHEALCAIDGQLEEVKPKVHHTLVTCDWQLAAAPSRDELEALLAKPRNENPVYQRFRGLWARKLADRLDSGQELATTWPLLMQGLNLAEGVRLVGIEGEPVAEHGNRILASWPGGVTFPLGYCNGEGAYLPTTPMLPQGGMEVDSYWEYCLPAPFAPGMERSLNLALSRIQDRGVT